MNIKELDAAAFRALQQRPFAVVDCYGDNCFACTLLAPVLEEVAAQLPEIDFGRVNVTREGDLGGVEINALPTLLFFRQGRLVHRAEGSMDAAALRRELGVMLYQ